MAYADLAESYIVITIIVILDKRQKNKYILLYLYDALDVKGNLSLSSLVQVISDEKKLVGQ